jgi:hypothetical protein
VSIGLFCFLGFFLHMVISMWFLSFFLSLLFFFCMWRDFFLSFVPYYFFLHVVISMWFLSFFLSLLIYLIYFLISLFLLHPVCFNFHVIYLFIYLFIYLIIYLFIYLFIYIFIYFFYFLNLFLYFFIFLFLLLPVCFTCSPSAISIVSHRSSCPLLRDYHPWQCFDRLFNNFTVFTGSTINPFTAEVAIMRLLGLCDQRRRSKVTGLFDLMTLFIDLRC